MTQDARTDLAALKDVYLRHWPTSPYTSLGMAESLLERAGRNFDDLVEAIDELIDEATIEFDGWTLRSAALRGKLKIDTWDHYALTDEEIDALSMKKHGLCTSLVLQYRQAMLLEYPHLSSRRFVIAGNSIHRLAWLESPDEGGMIIIIDSSAYKAYDSRKLPLDNYWEFCTAVKADFSPDKKKCTISHLNPAKDAQLRAYAHKAIERNDIGEAGRAAMKMCLKQLLDKKEFVFFVRKVHAGKARWHVQFIFELHYRRLKITYSKEDTCIQWLGGGSAESEYECLDLIAALLLGYTEQIEDVLPIFNRLYDACTRKWGKSGQCTWATAE